MKKTKKAYPEDFRTLFGFSTVSWVHGFSVMVFALFMQFLTDYSGIDAAIGRVGYAAAFGTALMLITRIVDAVDDPLQAWIMDRAKETKFGKYRKFTIWSIFLIGAGITLMFALPDVIKSNAVLLTIWIFVGYLLFEMGYAFNGVAPILQKSTYNANIRAKLTSIMRFAIIISVVPATFFIPIATAINGSIGDMGKSFTLTCVAITVISCMISMAGVICLKEPYRPNVKAQDGGDSSAKIKLKDVGYMLKHNKPMWVHCIAFFAGNMVFAVTSAVMVYFLKWTYSADLVTGAVDEIKYASIYGIYALLALIPNFLAPLVASFVVRKLGSIDRAMRICTLLTGVLYGVMFLCYIFGVLQISPFVFILLNFIAGIPASIAVIPGMLMWTECADYVEYTTGKNMTAMVNSVNGIISKAQSAISVIIPGIILVAVGYSVNSQTGAYAGDLAQLPGMVRNLTLVITLIPLAVSVISWAIYKFLYPITPEFREKMTSELQRRHDEAASQV